MNTSENAVKDIRGLFYIQAQFGRLASVDRVVVTSRIAAQEIYDGLDFVWIGDLLPDQLSGQKSNLSTRPKDFAQHKRVDLLREPAEHCCQRGLTLYAEVIASSVKIASNVFDANGNPRQLISHIHLGVEWIVYAWINRT